MSEIIQSVATEQPYELGRVWQEAVDNYARTVSDQHIARLKQNTTVESILNEVDKMEISFTRKRHDGSKTNKLRTLIRDSLAPIQALSNVATQASKAVR